MIDPLADQIFAMMQSAKVGDSLEHFVRETRPSPEPAFVLALDRQLDDRVRFCAIPDGLSVLTVDPTFNLGDFDVTPTTYRHRLLISTRSGKNPVMIGPLMIHYRKTFHMYVFFVATLVGLRRELVGLRAFGTDGEKALADAFSHEFHYAVHLTCFIHCCRNIKSQTVLAKKFLTTYLGVSMEIRSLKGLWTPLLRMSFLISWRFWKSDGMKLRRCMVHSLGFMSGSLETK